MSNTYKFYFDYSRTLGSISPMIGRGSNIEEAKKDLLIDLNSMLDHDGIPLRKTVDAIVSIKEIKILKE